MHTLPKWIPANLFPAIHDFESLTVLEQTARLHGAVQALITEYNNFSGTEEEAREDFETKMTKVMREFTSCMEQYLKINLDDTVTKMILKSFNDGSVKIPTDTGLTHTKTPADAAATGAAIAVERARINALTANNGSSTEGNAELIDIRAGFDGTEYPTAGDAVRGQVNSVYKNVAHLANIVGHNGDLFPHNKAKWSFGNKNYPGDPDRLRSEYIVINQRKNRINVENNAVDIRVYLELYGIDDSGGFVYMKDTAARLGSTVFNSDGAAAIRIVIHRKDNADLTPDDFYYASANIAIHQSVNLEQKKIRVMQYNLGEFNMGRSHDNPYVDQTKIADYIAEYKKFFGAEMADILCLEEFSEFIDAADTEYPTSETLIDGIYPNKTGVSYGNTLAARHTILEEEHIHYNNKNTDEVGCLVHTMVTKIYGREVFVCSGNLRVMATEETRKDTFGQLLSACEKYDYVILGLDMNALSEDENRHYVETAEANGFSVANGGYFGNIKTYLGNMYQNIDNIFVKGGLVVNAYAPDVSETLASDHLPIVADIILY